MVIQNKRHRGVQRALKCPALHMTEKSNEKQDVTLRTCNKENRKNESKIWGNDLCQADGLWSQFIFLVFALTGVKEIKKIVTYMP